MNQLGWKSHKLLILGQEKFLSYANMSVPEKTSVIFLSLRGLGNINKRLREIFLYELDQPFNFRDEYCPLSVQAETNIYTSGPNCTKDIQTAKKCWGDLLNKVTGYYKGCAGHEDYIKPTGNSLMSCCFLPGSTYRTV